MRKSVIAFLALAMMTVFVGSSFADVAFSTINDAYTSTKLGVIGVENNVLKVTGNKSSMSFDGDATLRAFDAGEFLLFAEHDYTGAGDSVYLFLPEDLSSPLLNKKIKELSNINDVVYWKDHLYIIGYNSANIVKVSPLDIATVKAEYTFDVTTIDDGYYVNGAALAVHDDELYAVFQVNDGNWSAYTYDNSRLIRLDEDLDEIEVAEVAKNAHTIASSGGNLYVASYGGAQAWSASDTVDATKSVIEKIDMTGTVMTTETILTSNAIGGSRTQIVALCFDKSGDALVAVQEVGASGTISDFYLLPGPLSASSTTTFAASLEGYMAQTIYDSVTGYFWFSANPGYDNGTGQLVAYSKNANRAIKKFTASDLGGISYNIVPVVKTTSDNNNDDDDNGGSSGGCAAGSYGILLVAAAGFAACRTRRNAG